MDEKQQRRKVKKISKNIKNIQKPIYFLKPLCYNV